MFITNQTIFEEIQSLKNLLNINHDKKIVDDLKEYPLYRAAKILGIGERKLRQLAIDQKIECMIEENDKATDGVTFRFTAKQIREYQERRIFKGKNTDLIRIEIDKLIENGLS